MKAEVYLRSGKIIELDNITEQEKSDLKSGLDSLSSENRIFVGEWTLDGKAVDAVKIIEEKSEMTNLEDEGYIPLDMKVLEKGLEITIEEKFGMTDFEKAEESLSQISYRIMDYENSGLLTEKYLIKEICKELDKYFLEGVTE